VNKNEQVGYMNGEYAITRTEKEEQTRPMGLEQWPLGDSSISGQVRR